jgi:rhodanese-related sulfurtransferase
MLWWLVKTLIRLKFPQVQSVSVATLANWLQGDSTASQQPLLLDARKPAEYQVSHLPEAQLAPADLSQLQPDDRPIVVYCSVGYRSARLAKQLQQMGFQRVFNLEGSIFEWANANYPVYRDSEIVHQVHPYNDRWGKLLRSDYRYRPDSPDANQVSRHDSAPMP